MKFINKFINTLKEFWYRFKLLFISKEKKKFAREALEAKEKYHEQLADNRSYFHSLPRRSGFKKAPSVTAQKRRAIERAAILTSIELARSNPKEKPKKKSISKEERDRRELAKAKRTFFINLISERAKDIQAPFIKEKRKKKPSFINRGKEKVATPYEGKKFKKDKPLHIASGQAGNQHKSNLKYHV